MDAQRARDSAAAFTAYAKRLEPTSTKVTVLKPQNSLEWRARRLAALKYVASKGDTITKAEFAKYCVEVLGYSASGLGSYYNKPEAVRLLHPSIEDGVEMLTLSVRACELLAADAA